MKEFNKDTVILVYYLNVKMLDDSDINEYITEINEHVKVDGNVIQYVIPVYDMDSYIDCVYPRMVVSQDQFDRVNNECIKLLEEIINKK